MNDTTKAAETAYDSGLYICQQLAADTLRLFNEAETSAEAEVSWTHVELISQLASILGSVHRQAEMLGPQAGAVA